MYKIYTWINEISSQFQNIPTLHTLYKVYNRYTHIEKHVGTELYVSSSYKLRGSCNVSGSWLTEFGMCTIYMYVLRCISQTMRIHRASVMWMYSIQWIRIQPLLCSLASLGLIRNVFMAFITYILHMYFCPISSSEFFQVLYTKYLHKTKLTLYSTMIDICLFQMKNNYLSI